MKQTSQWPARRGNKKLELLINLILANAVCFGLVYLELKRLFSASIQGSDGFIVVPINAPTKLYDFFLFIPCLSSYSHAKSGISHL